MASQVFYPDDVENIMRGLLLAALAQPAPDTPHTAAYRRGFVSGINAVAVALGIKPLSSTALEPQQ